MLLHCHGRNEISLRTATFGKVGTAEEGGLTHLGELVHRTKSDTRDQSAVADPARSIQ
jgi:hypothetical protein